MGGLVVRPPTSSHAFLFIVVAVLVSSPQVSGMTEAESLLKFKSSLSNQEAIPNWDPAVPPCSSGNTSKWLGVICINGNVWGLQLENMGLGGDIDIDALSRLPELKILSLMRNEFGGTLPELRRLPKLRGVYLSNNHFSGDIPDDAFSGMDSLRRLFLANNAFSGKIPSSLTKVPKLVELRLEGNQFEGKIPDFQQHELPHVDVANNLLEGPIPESLRNLNPASFLGNKGLCGPPLNACTNDKSAAEAAATTARNENPASQHKSSPSNTTIIVLAVLLALLILLLIIVFILVGRRKQEPKSEEPPTSASQVVEETNVAPAPKPPRSTSTKKRSEPGKLEFVRDDNKTFDLQDLLTASAEVLESGNFESSYKVEIFAGQMLVVKRFRQMSKVGREDFHEHIRRMGKLRHPNVLALVAYYYRREEKLLVFDFVDNGHLASHLYGKHTQNSPGLDWPTRLKIIKGVARGLAYLYSELPSLTVPHGYLKSSNVLLNESYEPLLMDYALLPLINPEQAKQLMVAYKSPEYSQHNRLTKKTDVWSLGILILEVLTGKVPPDFLTVGNTGGNLVNWVKEIASDEDNVFDKEMRGAQNAQGEMRKLLQIGFSCCHEDIEVRCSMKEALEKIEEVKETDASSTQGFDEVDIAIN